jgi:hypothetical protein
LQIRHIEKGKNNIRNKLNKNQSNMNKIIVSLTFWGLLALASTTSAQSLPSPIDLRVTNNVTCIMSDVEQLANGKYLVVGNFTQWNGITARGIVRLNSDGSFDNTFQTSTNVDFIDVSVKSDNTLLCLTNNGNIIHLGNNGNFISQQSSGIANFISGVGAWVPTALDSLDNLYIFFGDTLTKSGNFVAKATGANSFGYNSSIFVQPDQKVFIAGGFTMVNSVPISGIVRFNTNGTIDGTFNPYLNDIYRAAFQPTTGKIIALSTANGIIRMNIDGTQDTTFHNSNNLSGNQLNVGNDGSIYLIDYQGPNTSVRRLLPDGTSNMFAGWGYLRLYNTKVQADGKLIAVEENGFSRIKTCNNSFTAQLDTVGISCLGRTDGSIVLNLSNTVTPIYYRFDGGTLDSAASGSFQLNNLSGGYHSIYGVDNNACSFNLSGIVSSPNSGLPSGTIISNESCPGLNDGNATINITSSNLPLTYSVNSGSSLTNNTNTINLNQLTSGDLYINGTDSLGCIFNAYVNIQAPTPYTGEKVCLVTVDATNGYNQIIWEKTRGVNTAWFKLYKQNSLTSQYDSIGMVHLDSFSVFTDFGSNPSQQSASYALSVIDSCGNESSLSPVHTTIHLSANQAINGQVNLQWNAYDGFSYPNFEIYRSNNGSAFALIGAVANSSFSYTDLTPPSGTNYYYIAVTNPNGCNPSRAISKASSNILDGQGNPVVLGLEGVVSQSRFLIYPNPSKGVYNVEGDGIKSVTVYDAVGKEVLSKNISSSNFTVDLNNYAQGVYTIRLQLSNTLQTVKLIKE